MTLLHRSLLALVLILLASVRANAVALQVSYTICEPVNGCNAASLSAEIDLEGNRYNIGQGWVKFGQITKRKVGIANATTTGSMQGNTFVLLTNTISKAVDAIGTGKAYSPEVDTLKWTTWIKLNSDGSCSVDVRGSLRRVGGPQSGLSRDWVATKTKCAGRGFAAKGATKGKDAKASGSPAGCFDLKQYNRLGSQFPYKLTNGCKFSVSYIVNTCSSNTTKLKTTYDCKDERPVKMAKGGSTTKLLSDGYPAELTKVCNAETGECITGRRTR